MSKVRATVERIATVKQADETIGVLWKYGPTVALNPAHVVSQEPFLWSNDESHTAPEGYDRGTVGVVKGLKVKTVLGDTFYLDTLTYL